MDGFSFVSHEKEEEEEEEEEERLESHSDVNHCEGEGPREPTLENWPTTGH